MVTDNSSCSHSSLSSRADIPETRRAPLNNHVINAPRTDRTVLSEEGFDKDTDLEAD